MKRVLIVGLGKSGTTSLFFKVKNSMPASAVTFFEPRDFHQIVNEPGECTNLVAKMILPLPDDMPLSSSLSYFTHRVLIVRDPRDVLISFFLYNCASKFVWKYSEKKIKYCIRLLLEKEAEPTSLSVVTLFEEFRQDFNRQEFSAFVSTLLRSAVNLAAESNGFYVFRYEELVSQRFSNLQSYLQFPLLGKGEVDKDFSRVIRTRGSGDWKNWFVPDDVSYFKPIMDQFIDAYGYSDDWSMDDKQSISSQYGSLYFIRVLNERRQQAGLSLIDPCCPL